MTRPPFDRVVVDREVENIPFTAAFLGRVPPSVEVLWRDSRDPPPRGRRTVHLTREPGRFLRACPCSPGVVRCGYWILSPAFQCPFGCVYCFLRFYAPDAPLAVYANLEDAEREFRDALEQWPGGVRLGTGEFGDSLALDPWTRHSTWLVELVRPHPRVLLELKTKSDRIGVLLECPPAPNVVVAWSVNPPGIVRSEEPGTAPLDARLRSAADVARAGYRVAFHFDPVIRVPGWEAAYADVAEALFDTVPPDRIAWISLGTLRFPRRFLERWGARLRGRPAYFAEFVQGPDGKLRYLWFQRRDVYRHLVNELRRRGGRQLRIYLCMETPEMWGSVFGTEPAPEGDVERWLAAPWASGCSPPARQGSSTMNELPRPGSDRA